MKRLILILVAILTASICMAECPLTTWGSSDECGNIRVNIGLKFRFGQVKKDFSETFCKTVKTVKYDFAPVPIQSDTIRCVEAVPLDPTALATTLGETKSWSAGKTATVCTTVAGTVIVAILLTDGSGESGDDTTINIDGNGNQIGTDGTATTSGNSEQNEG